MQNRSRYLLLIVPLVFAAVIAACGGTQAPPPEAPAAQPVAPPPAAPVAPAADAGAPAEEAGAQAAADAGAPAPAQPKWADLHGKDQKKAFMKHVVLPKMKALLEEFDAKKFKKVTCITCHGKRAKKGKFRMPNPKLPKLNPANKFAKEMKKKPRITKFMMKKVVPTMADLLGMKPYDPKTKKGFGCFKCHTMAGGKHMGDKHEHHEHGDDD